jgi:hypothetical protein
MPLSESIKKPLIAERPGGPIAVFSNSYARLLEHFFARVSPTPVAKAHLIKFNESLASELGVLCCHSQCLVEIDAACDERH